MWWLYQALYALLLVTLGPLLLVTRGRHYLPGLRGRLLPRRALESAGGIWIHAVSVGEVAVAATLVRELPSTLPLVVTTITPTGQERARRTFGGRASVAYLPFELGYAVRRFFEAARPRAIVLVEGDYWPLLLAEATRRGVPVVVVNGRISDRSFPRLLRFRVAVRRLLLDRVARFGVQTALDGDRLRQLGVVDERVAVTGNLKFEAAAPPDLPELAEIVEKLAEGRPILVAGSTMPGEEEQLLEAFAELTATTPALLVLAPRHPERFEAVAELARRRFAATVRRSRVDAAALDAAGAAPPTILVLDSLGELAALYRSARVAFIGGTLVPRGGHNPIEAARFAVPVVVGRSMDNFREIATTFDEAGAWARVRDARDLARTWRDWLSDPAAAAETGQRGKALVDANRGAARRTLELLAPIVAPAESGPA